MPRDRIIVGIVIVLGAIFASLYPGDARWREECVFALGAGLSLIALQVETTFGLVVFSLGAIVAAIIMIIVAVICIVGL